METKKCSKCGDVKPVTKFCYHTSHGRKLPAGECRKCTLIRNNETRKKYIAINNDEMIVRIESSGITKKCSRCHKEKVITEFNVRRSSNDGHDIYCRDCEKLFKDIAYEKKTKLPDDKYVSWREEQNGIRNAEKLRLKQEVFEHYSSDGVVKCVNPYHFHTEDITDLEVLSLDHINGDGYKDKDENGRRRGGITFYRRLKLQGYPAGFQILCMNCQMKKKFRNKEWGDFSSRRKRLAVA